MPRHGLTVMVQLPAQTRRETGLHAGCSPKLAPVSRSPHVERGGRACGFCCGNDDTQHVYGYPCTGIVSSPPPSCASLAGALHGRTVFSHVETFGPCSGVTTSEAGECRYRDQLARLETFLWPLRSPIRVVFVFLVGMAPAVGLRLRSRHSELPNRV